jgi:hypothetical protein
MNKRLDFWYIFDFYIEYRKNFHFDFKIEENEIDMLLSRAADV